MNASQKHIAAYVVVALIAAFSLFQAMAAIDIARDVDYRGDIRACTQENLIKAQSNQRNAVLEQTASLVVDALTVIGDAQRPKGDETNKELARIAEKARIEQTNFGPAEITDCFKEFPKP
jgi:hypothetical protein